MGIFSSYDKNLDSLVSELLKRYKVISINEHILTLENGYGIWISNYPYAFGNLCVPKIEGKVSNKTKKEILNKILEFKGEMI